MTHPRVGARRAELRRQRARRRFRVALALTALFSLLGLGWLAVQSSLLDVDKVQVRGARRVSAGEVRAAAAVELGAALLVLDRGAVARRVEALPWVLDADVSVDLPGTLRIRVEERRAAAWVAAGKRFVLLDADARVLDARRRAPTGLPEVVTAEAAPEPGQAFAAARAGMRAIAAAPEGLRRRILSVEEDDGVLDVTVEGVDQVVFGRVEQVREKWQALEAVLQEAGDAPLHRVDVRVPGAPAVLRSKPAPPRPATTTTTAPAGE